MLIYHPVFDTNHGLFRMLRLLEASPTKSLQYDVFRIVDLYYIFPYLIGTARLPRSMTQAKKTYGKLDSRYGRIPTPRVFIQQLSGLHELVTRSLVGKGFIQADDFEQRQLLQRTEKTLPSVLIEAFSRSDDGSLVDLLCKQIAAIPLNGPDGLKARTGLLEHRYDAL